MLQFLHYLSCYFPLLFYKLQGISHSCYHLDYILTCFPLLFYKFLNFLHSSFACTHSYTQTDKQTDTHSWHTCTATCVLKCCHCLTFYNSHTHAKSHIRLCSCTNAPVKVGSIIFIFFPVFRFESTNSNLHFRMSEIVISIFTWLIGFIFNLSHTKGKLITAWHTPPPPCIMS